MVLGFTVFICIGDPYTFPICWGYMRGTGPRTFSGLPTEGILAPRTSAVAEHLCAHVFLRVRQWQSLRLHPSRRAVTQRIGLALGAPCQDWREFWESSDPVPPKSYHCELHILSNTSRNGTWHPSKCYCRRLPLNAHT